MKKQAVVITIVGTIEQGVAMIDLKHFASEAISAWGGQRHPDDPLFSSVDVTHISVGRIGTMETR